MKMFDYVIGNPPYNEDFENSGDNGNYAKPVYNYFMDATYELADKVELIHPARFLFNAGSTPKDWNKKMLSDEHFKVLHYEANSSTIFRDTDIKGGIAISYRDANKDFGAIENFIAFDELRNILDKVSSESDNHLSEVAYAAESYRFTNEMHEDFPEIEGMLSKGHKFDFKTNVLEKLNGIIFFDDRPQNGEEYVQIYGLVKAKRIFKWIKRKYIREAENFNSFKIFVPKANGSGALGEVLSTPLIGQPLIGHTQTFMSIGNFNTEVEAEACLKYVKGKFARTLLGILKITQDNPPEKWRLIPLQDFTPASDIDWTKSIHEIDLQLYKKYGLTKEEIDFIETHVKEMS